MSLLRCPACRRFNAADARQCGACGARLGMADTLIVARPPAPPPRDLAGVLWLDDLMSPGRQASPPPAQPDVNAELPAALADTPPDALPGDPREQPLPEDDLAITLREIHLSPPPAAPAPAAAPAENLVVSDPGVEVPVLRDALAGPEPKADGAHDWQTEQRAAKRAAVRRARLRHAAAPGGDEPAVPEVLVLDADPVARDQLCSLLRAFGFGVHSVAEVGKAAQLVASRPFVAAFVDIALDAADGGAGIDLCKNLKAPAAAGRPTALLVLVAAQLTPVDRVRASLAGCDETIVKPVTRGSVARALDGHGIALPSDARRA